MTRYTRSHAIAEGKKLVAQDLHRALGGQAFPGSFRGTHHVPFQPAHQHGFDTGGGLRWNAMGSFAPNPVYGMHPAQVMQIPPMSGPGGYTSPPNQNTPPAAIMAAQQAHASGGQVDENALAHAHRLLFEAKRACGGQVGGYKSGGEVKEPAYVTEAKRLLALIDRIDKENPRVSADKRFSYACQRAPGLSRFLKMLLQDGYSRSGARATINGALIRWADGQD
jgi:hypothetical protein